MGLFSKLKSSMDGGVQLHVQAPGSVPSNQVIPVRLTITADSSRTINSVKAELKAQAREQGITLGSGQGIGTQSSSTTSQTIAQVESREPFTISPGETKTIDLQLYLSGGLPGANVMAQMDNIGGALGGAMKAMASVAQGFGHVNYFYSVHASADVQDAHMSPKDKQSIQILPPVEAAPPVQPTTFVAETSPDQVQPSTSIPQPPVLAPLQLPQDVSAGQQGGQQV
jgi:hypothetical protein